MGTPERSGPGRTLLRYLVGEAEARALESELAELREARTQRMGRAAADRWYRREVARLVLAAVLMGRGRPLARRGGRANGLTTELRQAVRSLRRTPVTAAALVVTLALGLGGTAASWAVTDAVLLRPLPYASPDRLIRIYHSVQGNRWSLSAADWEAIAAQQTEMEALGASRSGVATLSLAESSERVRIREVTPTWFDVLGMKPEHGRGFVEADGGPGAQPKLLLGHGYWQRRFGGAPDVVGTRVRLNGVDHEVIGVLPRRAGPLEERHDLFPVLRLEPATRKGPFQLTVIGRLRRGVPPERAGAELRAINARIFPIWRSSWQDRQATYGAMMLAEAITGPVRLPVLALLGAGVFVLLVAALNVANLLVARAVERRGELAVRVALGASPNRIVRLLLAESAIVSLAGAAAGLVLAVWIVRMVTAAGPDVLPRAAEITLLDARVLPVIALLVAGTALFCGLLPATQALGVAEPGRRLAEAGRAMAGGRSAGRVRSGLVAAQFAVAAPLLVGAGLQLHGFRALQRVDIGIDTDGVISAGMMLPAGPYGEAASRAVFWRELLDEVGALPGVEAAGLANGRPPLGHQGSNNFDPLDRPTPPGQPQPSSIWLAATAGYFVAQGIPLLAGRMFDDSDGPETPPVVLVDRAWVRAWSEDIDPIGRRFRSGGCTGPDCWIATVIGVVDDVRYTGLEDTGEGSVRGTVYAPAWQEVPAFSYLHVRSALPPGEAAGAVRRIVRGLDPAVPLFDVATSAALIDEALARPRNMVLLAGAFGAIALLLAVVAIYGVMTFFVERQRRDIGIRLALGGAPRAVTWVVVRRGMRPALVGIAIGGVLALATARLLSGLLFGVSAADPATHAGVLALLFTAALLACAVPAFAATREAPLAKLREQ